MGSKINLIEWLHYSTYRLALLLVAIYNKVFDATGLTDLINNCTSDSWVFFFLHEDGAFQEILTGLQEIDSYFFISNVYSIQDYANYFIKYPYMYQVNLFIMNSALTIVTLYIYYHFVLFFFSIKNDTVEFYFFKVKQEIENNLSNYFDVKRLALLFLIILWTSLTIYLHFKLLKYVFLSLSFYFLINFITIAQYMFLFKVNVFVFLKGLLKQIKIFLNSILDLMGLLIFISRLVLQILRFFIICLVFYIFHEVCVNIILSLHDYYIMMRPESVFYGVKHYLRTIAEYIDVINNFVSQYAIYFISVIWLIPFLFTFVKKNNKN